MTMITPSYLGDTIEYSSYASNALGALPYGRPAGGRTSDSVGEPAEGSLKRRCPSGYTSHPLFIIPLLLWRARPRTTGFGWSVPARGPKTLFVHIV